MIEGGTLELEILPEKSLGIGKISSNLQNATVRYSEVKPHIKINSRCIKNLHVKAKL